MDMVDVRAEDVTAVVGEMFGPCASADTWRVEEIAYESGSPATGGLFRVRGTTGEGHEFSAFGKLLHHVRHWPRLSQLPEQFRDQFAAEFPWRGELAAWEPAFE